MMNGPELKQRRIDAGIEFYVFCDRAKFIHKKVQMIEDGEAPLSELFEEVYLYRLQEQINTKKESE